MPGPAATGPGTLAGKAARQHFGAPHRFSRRDSSAPEGAFGNASP